MRGECAARGARSETSGCKRTPIICPRPLQHPHTPKPPTKHPITLRASSTAPPPARLGVRVSAIAAPPERPSQQQQQQQQVPKEQLKKVPRLPGQLPYAGALLTVPPAKLFMHVAETERKHSMRMAEVELMGRTAVRLRHPEVRFFQCSAVQQKNIVGVTVGGRKTQHNTTQHNSQPTQHDNQHTTTRQHDAQQDIARVMAKECDVFVKAESDTGALADWLANGLATNRDASHHAAMREVMMPAFRAEAVRSYCGTFTDVADSLASLLLESEGEALSESTVCLFVFGLRVRERGQKRGRASR